MKVNIIVLNYNGEALLPRCLPSIIEAKKASKHPARVTVIDNESTDNSLDVLKRYSDEIDVVPCKNRVLCSFNDVVAVQEEEIAILLNNDIRVDPGFVDPFVRVFQDNEDAFMAAPKCFEFSGERLEGGRSKGFIKFGWFGALSRFPGWKNEIDEFGYSFQSGFGAVRKDRFVELGGYDDLYLPGRLEDSDICFRAWKKGWKNYYQPSSVVYHIGGESFKKEFGSGRMSVIDSRNSLLFFWKNIQDPGYWLEHIVCLPLRCAYWSCKGEWAAVKGVFKGFGLIADVLKSRKRDKIKAGRKDREIFNLFK